jgi:putative transposase/transposase-like zinc-binding protein
MSRPTFEVAHVIDQFWDAFISKYHPNKYTLRTLYALRVCRTSLLGGHKDQCDNCSKIRISYNSCRNRHCPKCQAAKQAIWVEDTSERIIDTKYFHVVFTLPHNLNEICLLDSKSFYTSLFASAWNTSQTFGYTHYGVEIGALSMLHTWDQKLGFHPHIHCLVPSAGLTLDGKFKRITRKGKYLFNVKNMSKAFRDNMLKRLKNQLHEKGQLIKYQPVIDQAWSKEWNVHSEPSFSDAEHVIKYLGQYTHRVAISNHRILRIDNDSVRFVFKDSNDNRKDKPITFTGVEFLRRFCMHILPKGFVKIRYYGIMSSRYAKRTILLTKRTSNRPKEKESVLQRIKRLTGFDMLLCPFCKNGQMYTIKVVPRIRSPCKIPRLKLNLLSA